MRDSRSTPGVRRVEEVAWVRPLLPLAGCVLLVSSLAHVRVPLLPEIGAELAMSPGELGLAVTLFGLGRLAMDLPAGSLADRFRPMRLMGVSALVMALGSAVLAAAGHPALVMTAFVMLGAASATGNTTGMTSLTGAAPAHRRGSAMALYSGCLLTGQALGPAVSGVVADLGGWRTAAAAGTLMGLAVAAIAFGWRRDQVGAGGKARRESRPGVPLTRVQVAATYAVGFCTFLTVGAMPQTLLPLIGDAELGMGVAAIGLGLGAGGVARVVGASSAGAISDRVSRRAALLPCLALQVVGIALLTIDAGLPGWLAALVLLSLGASAHAVAATMLADRGNPATLGRTLGRYRFTADIGLVVGPVLAASVYEGFGRAAAAGGVAAIVALGSLAATLVLPETAGRG